MRYINSKSINTSDQRDSGFTIVELMIASAVFSAVLLISLIGFLQLGKIFYKGVAVSQTSQTTRDVTEDLKSDIVYAADVSHINPVSVNGYRYFCVGSSRYIYRLDTEVDTSSSHGFPNNFGLLKDTLTVSGCPAPSTPLNNPVELLGNKMRLSEITIAPLNNKLYNLVVRVSYGDNMDLDRTNPTVPHCLASSDSSTYCYIYSLNTVVRRGY